MKIILKRIIKAFLLIILITTLPYYYSVSYNFYEGLPFKGNTFYNPYKNLDNQWLKCNFHSHSKTMFGFANGKNSAEEMQFKYDSMNYDVFSLSNYNAVYKNNKKNIIKAYEHGLNIRKTHQLVLNDENVAFLDYPYWQSLSNKQFIINHIRKKDNVIALAHPSFQSCYLAEDMKFLSNYDMIEAVSVRSIAIKYWDVALSSGHAVWVLGSDDSHNNTNSKCGVCWNMINVKERSCDEIIKSLKNGQFYATKGWLGQEMNRLKSLNVENNVYHLYLTQKAASIELFSDDGKKVAEAYETDSIVYQIDPKNTYVRAEIFNTVPWNSYTRTYLNPVIRTETIDTLNKADMPQINWFKTIFSKLLLIIFHTVLILIILKWK